MSEATLQGNSLKHPRIRPIAICLFRHGDRILVGEDRDPAKDETFYRPLGGGIEFGESSRDAVEREISEEMGLEVDNLRYLFAIENIFTFNGAPGHEIVMVYDGEFADSSVYDKPELECCESNNLSFRAVWKRLDEFGEGKPPLYPSGLLEMLSEVSD